MKRSEINQAIIHARNMLKHNHIYLPDFAYWNMEQWRQKLPGLTNLRQIGLGWDVTDFGTGQFSRCGSVLFTVRNGKHGSQSWGTPYAEKLIFQLHITQQEIPMHFHTEKTEDIINRGGGILMLSLYQSQPDGTLDTLSPVNVRMDGMDRVFKAGIPISVHPGNSITLTPGLYHRFWAQQGADDLVVGEVSSINDDSSDNTFLDPSTRFMKIEEDEPPLCPLCNEYERFMQEQAQA